MTYQSYFHWSWSRNFCLNFNKPPLGLMQSPLKNQQDFWAANVSVLWFWPADLGDFTMMIIWSAKIGTEVVDLENLENIGTRSMGHGGQGIKFQEDLRIPHHVNAGNH